MKYNHASELLLIEYTTLSCLYLYPSSLMVISINPHLMRR
ncbi:hypothetical protein HMPREF1427_00444 [Helicobacter pylori GAM83Bi]|nr:hypothetical protein HMPREF1427_00444 [Helicobacter pylori GAM83Bi]